VQALAQNQIIFYTQAGPDGIVQVLMTAHDLSSTHATHTYTHSN